MAVFKGTLWGGGKLIDQGVHLIDLSRWLTGKEVTQVYGKTFKSFWKCDVEDNAFFHLEFSNKNSCSMSCKLGRIGRIFSLLKFMEKNGYLKIEGLGGSYGKERLEVGYRQNQGSVPSINKFEFDNNLKSWLLEWQEFKQAILENREPISNGNDGYVANVILDAIYKSNQLNKPIILN